MRLASGPPLVPTGSTAAPGGRGAPVLTINGLSVAVGGQRILEKVSLELPDGSSVLIRGPNGAGKTTLLNALAGFVVPQAGTITWRLPRGSRRLHFPLHAWWPDRSSLPEALAELGVVRSWQDVRLFTRLNVEENVAVAAPEQLGESPWGSLLTPRRVVRAERALVARVAEVLSGLGLTGHATHLAGRLSLGQSKRVAHARMLRAAPALLLLDEPLAGLDRAGRDEVLSDLRAWRDAGGAIIVTEHAVNIASVLPLVDQVWTVENGAVHVEDVAAVTQASERGGGDLLTRLGGERAIERTTWADGSTFCVARRDLSAPSVLEVEGLAARRGPRRLPGMDDGWSFRLGRGDVALWRAPNGTGKTTCLEAIAGLCPVERGTIRLRGAPVEGLPAWKRSRMGLRLLSARRNTFFSVLAREALELAEARPLPQNLEHLFARRINTLSGGERQQVALHCLFAGPNADVYLLDEPFLALDHRAIETLVEELRGKTDAAILIVEPSPD